MVVLFVQPIFNFRKIVFVKPGNVVFYLVFLKKSFKVRQQVTGRRLVLV